MSHLLRLLAYILLGALPEHLLINILTQLSGYSTTTAIVELIISATLNIGIAVFLLHMVKINNINFKASKISIIVLGIAFAIYCGIFKSWVSMIFVIYLAIIALLANPEDQDMTGAPKGYVIPKPIAKVLNKHNMVENAEDQILENEDADDYDD